MMATKTHPSVSVSLSLSHRKQSQCSLCCPHLFLNEHIASDILALSLSAEASGTALLLSQCLRLISPDLDPLLQRQQQHSQKMRPTQVGHLAAA